MQTPKLAFVQFPIALRSLSAFSSTQLFWACFAEIDEAFSLVEIPLVNVVGCGCARSASMATDIDAAEFDAGNRFGQKSDLGQMVKYVMLRLRQDIVLHSGAKSWTRQIMNGLVGLLNIKNSLPTRYRLGDGLLQAWPGNKNRSFQHIALKYLASLYPDLIKIHYPSSAESLFYEYHPSLPTATIKVRTPRTIPQNLPLRRPIPRHFPLAFQPRGMERSLETSPWPPPPQRISPRPIDMVPQSCSINIH